MESGPKRERPPRGANSSTASVNLLARREQHSSTRSKSASSRQQQQHQRPANEFKWPQEELEELDTSATEKHQTRPMEVETRPSGAPASGRPGRRRPRCVGPGGRAQLALLAGLLLVWAGLSLAQSAAAKGRQAQPAQQLAQSPGVQLRLQQQHQAAAGYQPTSAPRAAKGAPAGQRQAPSDSDSDHSEPAQTDDPLANSEPALYGSVAGQPGIDFPGYTRIPKTSFTCEGKGHDFGFYADEEAGCQVYHVCWSGRRESFLCGLGTVFNQAILACDYWHSVDCSKSAQFYGANSELGRAGAEPAPAGQRQQQQRRTVAAPSTSAALGAGAPSSAAFGEPLSQRRPGASNQLVQQQQRQLAYNDDFEQPIVQQATRQPAASKSPQSNANNANNNNPFFGPQRNPEPAITQQQVAGPSKTGRRPEQQQQQLQQAAPIGQPPPVTTTTTLATPAAKGPRQQLAPTQRFNMDLSQKVNSLIESPVRPPLKAPSAAAKQRQQQQQQQVTTTRRPVQQNFAQLAVARAQAASSAGRKAASAPDSYVRQQQFDAEVDEPQLQQQSFDESPVQTSTIQSTATTGNGNYNGNTNSNNNNYNRQQPSQTNEFAGVQQSVVQAGGNAPDGSSAITMQYDTLVQQPLAAGQQQQQLAAAPGPAADAYESPLDDSSGGALDDFRAAGAKAAASHNQNWYIMRAI